MIQNEQIREAMKDTRRAIKGGQSLINIIKHGYELRNQTCDDVVAAKLCKELLKKVNFSFKDLRINEFALIIDEGCFGGFGDVYGMTAPTMFGWIQRYFELYGKFRQEALADYSLLALPPSERMTEADKMQQWQKNIQDLWEDFKKNPETLFHRPTGFHAGAAVFAFLTQQNPTIFDDDFKRQCWEKVKNQKVKYINYHVSQVNSGLGGVKGILKPKENLDEKFVLGLALKTVMVNEYFTALHQNGMELFNN